MSSAPVRIRLGLALVVVCAACSGDTASTDPASSAVASVGESTTTTAAAPAVESSAAPTTATRAPTTTTAPTATTPASTVPETVASSRDCGAMTSGEHRLDIDGVARSFEVVAPDQLAQPDGRLAPVIVLFHGFASTAANIVATSGLDQIAAASDVVLVAPQAVGQPTGWHIDQPEFHDSEFTDAVLAEVRASDCIDPDRIWLAGFSAGSAWAGVYGCSHTAGIAGLLMHSGLAPPICPADSTPNIYIVHGVADPFVPFTGGPQTVGTGTVVLQSVPDSAAGWASTAGCGADASVRTVGERDTITTWTGCAGGRAVMFQAVAGLGHAWSGGSDAPGSLNPGCVLVQMLSDARDAIAECATESS